VVQPQIAYRVISRHRNKYPITIMCKFFKVSRSGYYDWIKRDISKSDEIIGKLINEIQESVNQTYGYRRMKIAIKRETGMIINHKAVYRIMARYGLQSVIRRKYNYKGSQRLMKYDNLLQRNFRADRPNQKWCTDISYIITKQGRLYLSVIKDTFDSSIVAYKYLTTMSMGLVTNTIKQAMKKEKVADNLILHSDQGLQYTSHNYNVLTKAYGIKASMSRAGTPLDNAPVESFFGTLKSECIYRQKLETLDQARKLIDRYIDFYNNDRIQLKSKMTPAEVRKKYLAG